MTPLYWAMYGVSVAAWAGSGYIIAREAVGALRALHDRHRWVGRHER